MASVADLRHAGELQARLCSENDAPTYAAIIDRLVQGLDDDGLVAVDLLRSDPTTDPVGSALYLRLLAAAHRLALADRACPLRRYLPTTGGSTNPVEAASTFLKVAADNAELITREMRQEVQTNEVGRAVPLMAAFNYVNGRLGGPLRLLEVGASAGLNLWVDRYRIEADEVAWGPVDSPLRLRGDFVSGQPPDHEPEIAWRRGCDVRPLDIGTERGRLLLRSFVWPDHTQRFERLNAAIEAAGPSSVDRADARSWLARQLDELPAGHVTVVYHSMLLPYLQPEERDALKTTIRHAGKTAGDARLAWVWLEPERGQDGVVLGCQLWPHGDRMRLATSNPHGADLRWDPTPADDPSPDR